MGLELDRAILDAIAEVSSVPIATLDEVDEIPVVDVDKAVHWAPLLQTVLWVYRATPHSATGLSPPLLALGRELRMPMDIGADPLPAGPVEPFTDDEHRAIIAKHLRWVTELIEGLQELRFGRRDSTCAAQFQLGQKVWKREPRYDGKGPFVPIFASRWTGPYVIHSVFDKNVYKLRTVPDGTKRTGYLKNPVNGSRLKPYVDGDDKVV